MALWPGSCGRATGQFVADRQELEFMRRGEAPHAVLHALVLAVAAPAALLQGVSPHWTPENLAKSQALYKLELHT